MIKDRDMNSSNKEKLNENNTHKKYMYKNIYNFSEYLNNFSENFPDFSI